MRTSAAIIALCLGAGAALAQDGGAPLSAVDWLSDSVAAPRDTRKPAPAIDEPDVADSVSVASISVAPLGQVVPDAVGLLPVAVTGLPRDLWGGARPEDIARHIRAERTDELPAIQELLYTLILAELDPPESPGSSGHDVFLARVDKLLELGALDQAEALLERAGPDNNEVFRRWFDTALLLGREDNLCAIMRATPELSPTFTARVFCLARGGDWNAAVLTLDTGRALGFISAEDDALLARFLDPELFEGDPPLPRPARLTPLTFRMFEAIGEPFPTATLPRAFAHSDLRPTIGWKARIEAAERLARTGAVSENQLFGIYTERAPAASGGVWERVAAVQALDRALKTGDNQALSEALPKVWTLLAQRDLEVPLARGYGEILAGLTLSGEARAIALELGLLSDRYEALAAHASATTPREDLLLAVARGDVSGQSPTDPREIAVIAGFSADAAPVRLRSLIESGRLGEAILRAMTLFSHGVSGELDEVTDALALFRAVGLENTARRAALEYLILDRRG